MAIDWDAELLGPVMGVFGEDAPCRYMPAAGGPFDLPDAVFDEQSGEITFDGDTSATVLRPVLGVRLALFPAAGAQPPLQNDRVLIQAKATVYMVKDVRDDGHGWSKLVLMVAKDQSVA